MKPCPCWSCTISRALHRVRWLFSRSERQALEGAICHGIELAEAWGACRMDAARGLPTMIDGRMYVPARRKPGDEMPEGDE